MIVRIKTKQKTLFLLEVQRKKKRRTPSADDLNGTVVGTGEHSAFGLLLDLSSAGEPLAEITSICAQIGYHCGKFRELSLPRHHHHWVLHKRPTSDRFPMESTVVKALSELGIRLPESTGAPVEAKTLQPA